MTITSTTLELILVNIVIVMVIVYSFGRKHGFKAALKEAEANDALYVAAKKKLDAPFERREASYRIAASPEEVVKRSCSECKHLKWLYLKTIKEALPENLYDKPPGDPVCLTGEEIFDNVRGKRRLPLDAAVKNKNGDCPDFKAKVRKLPISGMTHD